MSSPQSLPTIADIDAAAARIAAVRIRTPLLESPVLNARLGGRLLLKAENLQITGSFKFRGAFNRLSVLTAKERARGVVARSSGNHGLAIAYCARLHDTHAIVVAPITAPKAKIDQIRAFGAEAILADMHDIARVAAEVVKESNRILVPPADDPWIVAGAGTVGREIAQQVAGLDTTLDALLVPCSGGGLTSGCTVAMGALSPATKVFAVEPEGFEKMARSLAAGHRVNNEPGGHTICDALSGPYMAEIPFELVRGKLAGALAVSDEEVRMAMRAAFTEFGLAIEPGAAVGLAAVLSGRFPIEGKTVAVMITGRNVDLEIAREALTV